MRLLVLPVVLAVWVLSQSAQARSPILLSKLCSHTVHVLAWILWVPWAAMLSDLMSGAVQAREAIGVCVCVCMCMSVCVKGLQILYVIFSPVNGIVGSTLEARDDRTTFFGLAPHKCNTFGDFKTVWVDFIRLPTCGAYELR